MRRLIVALLVAVAWSFGGPAKPYPTGAYDASSARAYFGRRPLRVAARSLEILWRSAGFGARAGRPAPGDAAPLGPRADDRGRELTDLLVALGPAFIKIGQSASLDEDLRLTLIEHAAHLAALDYAKVPGDLVRLGFVPKGGEDAAADAGVVDLLTRAYSKRAEGGGFANFDIPPYFAYIAKAFATLEGIGLGVDPDYSILNDTLPYISERMLSDPSPPGRARDLHAEDEERRAEDARGHDRR
ncbi:hypothetical protein SO694_00115055 [Aureococcus anophagefferens]|uniref:Uncharacterized protein n=1 Tax=Aureococcus anophagefferens TaxID=44056 RepID=A0ABR1FWQ0_AURAN